MTSIEQGGFDILANIIKDFEEREGFFSGYASS